MKRPVSSFFIFLLITSGAAAQNDQIKTDRPSETQTPELVPEGFLQVEAGLRKNSRMSLIILYGIQMHKSSTAYQTSGNCVRILAAHQKKNRQKTVSNTG